MNILMVADVFFPDVTGGSGRVVFELSKGLAAKGHKLVVCTRRKDKRLAAEQSLEGFRVCRYDVAASQAAGFVFSSLRNSRALAKSLAKDNRFDCLIFSQPLSMLGVLSVKKLRRLPKIYFFHSSWPQEYFIKNKRKDLGLFLRKFMERLALSKSDAVVAASRYSKNLIEALYPKLRLNITIMANGVDRERFQPVEDKAGVRGRLNIPLNKRVLLTIRNLTPRMGLENLIAAFRKVKDTYKDTLLIIGGSGRLEQPLKEQAAALGLENSIIFAGNIDDDKLSLYYQAADIFILPTREMEGFGLVTLEALSCGLPVLGTPVGATPEILRQLDEQLVFESADSDAMASRIMQYLAKPEHQMRQLAVRARQFVADNYSWEKSVSSTEKLAKELVFPSVIKVLHVHTLPVITGSDIHVLLTLDGLDKNRYKAEFACSPGGPLEDEIKSRHIPFRAIPHLRQPVNPYADCLALWELVRLMRKQRYHIVHTHNSKAGFIGRLASHIARVPVTIHTIHGFSFHDYEKPPRQALFLFLERLAWPWADKLITVSEPLKQWGLSCRIGKPSQYVTIHDGIELEKYRISVNIQAKRKELGIPAGHKVIGMVSKLWDGKGHACLLKALQEIAGTIPAVTVLFVGEGYLRPKLEKTVKDLALEKHVIFTGFRRDIPEVTAVFDLAVLASFFEGLGRVLLEAMASGKAVVATRVGGIVDVVDDGITGLLVEAGNPAALAEAIKKLLLDDNLRKRMAEAGRVKISEKFSAQVMVAGIERVYEEMLGKKGMLESAEY